MPARRSPCGHVPGFALHPERGLWLNGVIRLSLRGRLLPFTPKKTFFADEKSHAHSLRIGPTPMPPMALRRSSMSAIFRSALQFSGAWPVRARQLLFLGSIAASSLRSPECGRQPYATTPYTPPPFLSSTIKWPKNPHPFGGIHSIPR